MDYHSINKTYTTYLDKRHNDISVVNNGTMLQILAKRPICKQLYLKGSTKHGSKQAYLRMNITVNIDPEEEERIKVLINEPPRFFDPPLQNENRTILEDGSIDSFNDGSFSGIQLPPVLD